MGSLDLFILLLPITPSSECEVTQREDGKRCMQQHTILWHFHQKLKIFKNISTFWLVKIPLIKKNSSNFYTIHFHNWYKLSPAHHVLPLLIFVLEMITQGNLKILNCKLITH